MNKKDKKQKILELLEIGRDIVSACNHVAISRQTFYNWSATDTKFTQNVEFAKNSLERKSKQLIGKALETGDLSIAKRYLDKKSKSETQENVRDPLGDIIEEIMGEENDLITL